MKPRHTFASKFAIFQGACAFISGYLLSLTLLRCLESTRMRFRSDDWKDVTWPDENSTASSSSTGGDSSHAATHMRVMSGESIADESGGVKADEARPKVGCFVLQDTVSLPGVIFSTWFPQCDVNMTIIVKHPFPISSDKASPSLQKLYELYGSNLDYYLFAQPDTYIAVENLKEYLTHCDPDQPAAYGHPVVKGLSKTSLPWYTVGGTMVLSRGAVLKAMKEPNCTTVEFPTTTKMLNCLRTSGGNLFDSRDQFSRNTFLAPVRPFEIITATFDDKFAGIQKFSSSYCDSVNCLSDFPIAFHKMSAYEMHLIHFFINWAHFSHYTGTNKYSKLRLHFNGSKLPLAPEP